jgi:hypothetical protein
MEILTQALRNHVLAFQYNIGRGQNKNMAVRPTSRTGKYKNISLSLLTEKFNHRKRPKKKVKRQGSYPVSRNQMEETVRTSQSCRQFR